MSNQHFTWVEISKSALKHNIQQYKKVLSKSTQIMAVVKSNAYGHGMVETAKLAIKYGAKWLATVNLDEALELRQAGIKSPVLVLSYYQLDKKLIKQAIQQNISLVVYSVEQLKFLNQVSLELKKSAQVHLKIDTGTTRLGILVDHGLDFIKQAFKFKNLKIQGLFSHFAASEENQQFTQQQLDKFKNLIQQIEKLNLDISLKHFSCSAAALVKTESNFDLMRLGIGMYGLWPSELTQKIVQKKYPNFNLKPALSLCTRIIQIKTVPKGTRIGYGCTYKTAKSIQVAILPIGYWEGFDRHLSNKNRVIIKDKFCQVLGRVCMNLIMVDVTGIKNLKAGERAILIGRQGDKRITADDWAKKIGTINYEVVTRINPNLPRIYV
ncbi:MAG: alanine racemase [Patescibacteria group bacterium]|nr:alanine racemase [Patescibacteria group bacterium]